MLLITTGLGIINTTFPPFLKHLGWSDSHIGFTNSIFGVMGLMATIPSSLAYTAGNGRRLLRFSLGLLAISSFGFAFSSASTITAFTMINGFSGAMATMVIFALLMDLLSPGERRGRILGWFTACISAGYTLGNFLGGVVADIFGFGAAYVLAGMFPLVSALLVHEIPVHLSARRRKSLGLRSAFKQQGQKLLFLKKFKLLSALLLMFSLNFLNSLLNTFFPLYALKVGLSLTLIGSLMSLRSLLGTITRPIGGEATRYLRHELSSILGITASCLALMAIPSFTTFAAFIFIFAVIGVCRGALRVTSALQIAEGTDKAPEARGISAGAYSAAQDLGSILGPLVGGVLAATLGLENVLRISPLLLLAAYVTIIALRRRWWNRELSWVKA